MTASISVLTDPATCDIVSSELASCPRAAAVLGELAAQWQKLVPRVEHEAICSQSLANATENMNRTRAKATRDRLRWKDGERLYPKSWSGSTPLQRMRNMAGACRSEARCWEEDPARHERDVEGD